MSGSISSLLTHNHQEVFGENDPARLRGAIDELYTEDGVFYDLREGVYRVRSKPHLRIQTSLLSVQS